MQNLITPTVLALVFVGCAADVLAPFQAEITNQVDSFELQATDIVGVTSTITYEWEHTGTAANVDHSTVTTQGQAKLVVRDAAGAVVYDKLLTPSLNEPTLAGVAGTWMIDLVMTDYSGTLNFRLQKP